MKAAAQTTAAPAQAAHRPTASRMAEQNNLTRKEVELRPAASLFGAAPVLSGGAPEDPGARSGGTVSDAFMTRLSAARAGGKALDTATRTAFEARFGRSLSHVRLHDDGAADGLSREIHARAFTFGNDIYFARGALDADRPVVRHLLAHEITHTLQGGGPVIRRAEGEGESVDPARAPGDVRITFHPNLEIRPVTFDAYVQPGSPLGPLYSGDLFQLVMRFAMIEDGELAGLQGIVNEINLQTSGDLELVEAGKEGQFVLRVTASEADIGGGKVAEIAVSGGAFTQAFTIPIELEPLPAAVEVRDPAGVTLDAKVGALKTDRAAKRAARRAEKKAHRGERRAYRAETRAARDELRAEQQASGDADRAARREARQALRQERRQGLSRLREEQNAEETASRNALRQARRDLRAEKEARGRYDEEAAFDRSAQAFLQEAASTAAARAAAALSATPAVPQPGTDISAALTDYFRITPDGTNGEAVTATLQRIRDVLSLAHNGLRLADYEQFQTSEDCREETGAYVVRTARGASVTVCEKWIEGDVDFGVCNGAKDCRAFALLHEFIHTAGVDYTGSLSCGGTNEVYTHCTAEWAQVTPPEALTLADAYAAFAWRLGGGT